MKNRLVLLLPMLAALVIAAAPGPAERNGPPLAHMVFFTLKDHSQASREKLIASCEKYLSGHEGAVSFSVGTVAEDVKEPVSVLDFDVALVIVFKEKSAKTKYLTHPRHHKFVEENRTRFANVRVFDSYLAEPKH